VSRLGHVQHKHTPQERQHSLKRDPRKSEKEKRPLPYGRYASEEGLVGLDLAEQREFNWWSTMPKPCVRFDSRLLNMDKEKLYPKCGMEMKKFYLFGGHMRWECTYCKYIGELDEK